MNLPREHVVQQLMTAMTSALAKTVHDTEASADELFSACFTLTKCSIVTARDEFGASADVLRAAVEQLLIECIDKRVN